MNLCLSRIAPKTFLKLEARLGRSRLQNFDAILRNQGLSSHTSPVWRTVILLSLALPLGLSVAFKRFIGGSSSHIIYAKGGNYGLIGPPGILQTSTQGLGLAFNATQTFMLAASNNSVPPPLATLPQAYGYNMLLLSNTSTAYLDVPMPDYITSIQHELASGETRNLTAPVKGVVTSYDPSVETHRSDPKYWEFYYSNANIEEGNAPVSIMLYNDYIIGLLAADIDSWAFLGLVETDTGAISSSQFNAVAMKFNTARKQCTGTWLVAVNDVKLIDGACDELALPAVSQEMFSLYAAYPSWYMPTLAEYLTDLTDLTAHRPDSPWQMPTFTTVIAAMYWSRTIFMTGKVWPTQYPQAYALWNETSYFLPDQAHFIKPTLRSTWLLYVVLAVQPVLTVVLLVMNLMLKSTPVTKGFGTASILAGMDQQSLHVVRAASLSGELPKDTELQIIPYRVEKTGRDDEFRIAYVLRDPHPPDWKAGETEG